jgi:hypothetical protein
MKKLSLLLPALAAPFAIHLLAADFWVSKPYAEWTEKEILKIETSSPWSKQVTVEMGRGGAGGDSSGKGGGRSKGGGGGGGTEESKGGGQGAGMMLTVSWRTALPVREAYAKQKYGAELETSADAKKLLTEEPKSYVVLVSGLRRPLRSDDNLKDTLIKSTGLMVKGKDPIVPSDVQMGTMDKTPVVVFIFPRTTPITVDDKEVEFSTKLGPLTVKQKFHLKDMVLNGKLEL